MSTRLQREALQRKEPPQAQYESYPTKKMSSREISDSAQRLSRAPQKYSSLRPTKTTGQDSFAASYFSNNPDHIPDKRSPQEKLDEIQIRLDNHGIDDNERFNLLIQRKSLCMLAHGENSQESLQALIDLGKFYNDQNRPESALRNLSKALSISKSIDVDSDSGLALAIELATANLDSKALNKTEQSRQLANAEAIMKPYQDIESDDKILLYRRDLVMARMCTHRQNYKSAMERYQSAWDNLDQANNGSPTPETATLFDEMGDAATKMGDKKKANDYYQNAYETFCSLDMQESAELIAKKLDHIPVPRDYDETRSTTSQNSQSSHNSKNKSSSKETSISSSKPKSKHKHSKKSSSSSSSSLSPSPSGDDSF